MANAEISITIGTITFNAASSFTSQVGYFLEEVQKTISTLQTRVTTTEKQSAHGVVDSLSFYKERPLPFKGTIVGTSQSDRKTKEEALKKVLGLPYQQNFATNNGYVLVLITDEDGSLKQCYAKILDPPIFDVIDNTDPTMRSFSFQMMAADKNLYGQSLQSVSGNEIDPGTNFSIINGVSPQIPFSIYTVTPSSVIATNNGTTGSPPVITITGPTVSPEVLNITTGKYMNFTGLTLLAGETLTIDVGATSILKTSGGVATDASGYLTTDSQWLIVEGGANSIAVFDASPGTIAATLQVQWRDAYL